MIEEGVRVGAPKIVQIRFATVSHVHYSRVGHLQEIDQQWSNNLEDQLDLFEHMLEEEFSKGKTQQITEGMKCVAHIHGLYHRVKVLSIEDRN
ncbi:hypothetical protein CHS0354_023502 [Potamilus streckersoni]|uniref:Uncharacterized protein n=1 Tax=Potamilus streckersoni TaxID=2493646 RepID=A0AAE0RVC1_9BIVA|nr:hypothetical protein CHS0354_023502 [Potamilus streckersoni]